MNGSDLLIMNILFLFLILKFLHWYKIATVAYNPWQIWE